MATDGKTGRESAADRAAVVAATPLTREGTPADANRLILYLLEGTD